MEDWNDGRLENGSVRHLLPFLDSLILFHRPSSANLRLAFADRHLFAAIFHRPLSMVHRLLINK